MASSSLRQNDLLSALMPTSRVPSGRWPRPLRSVHDAGLPLSEFGWLRAYPISQVSCQRSALISNIHEGGSLRSCFKGRALDTLPTRDGVYDEADASPAAALSVARAPLMA